MRLIKQIWYLFSRRNRFKAISLYFLILFNVFLEILSIGSIVPILIFFLDKENIETIYIVNYIFIFLNIEYSEKAFFNLILISIFFLYLMKSITLILQFYLESNLSWNVIHDVRKNLFEKYLLSEMTYHNNIHTSTIINNLSKELNFAFHAVSNLIQIFSQFTLSIIICLTLIIFKPALYFIIFFLILGTLLIYNFFTSKNLKRLSTSRQTTEEKVTRFIINGLGGIRELKVFNTEKTFLNIFNDIAKRLIKISKKMHIYISLPKLILEMIIVSAILIMLYNFVGKDFNTSYILTTAGVFTLASIKLLPSISKIYHGYQSFKINTPSVEIIFDDLQDLKKVKNQRDKKFNTKLIFLKNLILKDISFNYGKKQIFDKANLTINRLEFLGIKGESGVGISTLIDLILD